MIARGMTRRRDFGLMLGVLVLAGGLAVAWTALSLWQTERRFDGDALQAEGAVLGRELRKTRRIGGSSGSTKNEYWVRYGFRDATGTWRESASRVDLYAWNSLTDGGPVTVAYLADAPDTSRVAGKEEWLGVVVMGALGGFALMFGGVVLTASLRRRRQQD